MEFFDSIFGGLFDFDSDDTTDLEEEILGIAVIDDIDPDECEQDSGSDFDEDF